MNIGTRFKRVVAGVATLFLMTFLIAPTVSAQSFGDVPENHWAYDYVEAGLGTGAFSAADNFRPDDTMNRAELTKTIIEATNVGIGEEFIPDTPTFADVPVDAWYYEYVETAVMLGIVDGYTDASGNKTGFFGPGDDVNRAAAVKMIVGAFGLPSLECADYPFVDVQTNDWFAPFVQAAYDQGVVNGYTDADGNLTGLFGPADAVTRAQIAKMIIVAGDPDPRECEAAECQVDADCDGDDICQDGSCLEAVDCTTDGDCDAGEYCEDGMCRLDVVGTGELEIVLNDELQLEDAEVPNNATRVNYLATTFINHADVASDLVAQADDGIMVYSVTLTREGLGDNSDFDEVWAEIDGERVTNITTVTAEDKIVLRFTGGLFILAGASVDVQFLASMNPNLPGPQIGDTNRLVLASTGDVDSSAARVIADTSLRGPLLKIANYGVANLEVTVVGGDRTHEVGDTDVELGRLRIRNTGGTGDKAVVLKEITLRNIGTLDAENLSNLKAKVNGIPVSLTIKRGNDGDLSDGDDFTFVFDVPEATANAGLVATEYVIDNGDSRTIVFSGNIDGGDGNGNTVNFRVGDGDKDIVGEEVGTRYGVRAVAVGDAAINNLIMQVMTINAGDLNIARHIETPGATTITPGTDDILFLIAKMTTSTDLLIRNMYIDIQVDMGTALIAADSGTTFNQVVDNVRLNVVGPQGLAYASDLVAVSDNGRLVASENTSESTLDALDTADGSDDDTVEVSLQMREDWEAESTAVASTAGYLAGSSLIAVGNELQLLVFADVGEPSSVGDFNGSYVRFTIDSANFDDVEYPNGDPVQAASRKGIAEGSRFEFGVNGIDCIRNDGQPATNVVAGDNDINNGRFSCSNSDETVHITDLTFDFHENFDGTNSVENSDISNVRLYADEEFLAEASVLTAGMVQVNGVEDAGPDPITFDGLDITLPPNSDIEFEIHSGIDTTAADGGVHQVALVGMTATDADGDDIPAADITINGEAAELADAAGQRLLGRVLNVVASGYLRFATGGSTPDGEILIANSYDVPVFEHDITAEDDDVIIDELHYVYHVTRLIGTADENNGKTTNAHNNGTTNFRLANIKVWGEADGLMASTLLGAAENVVLGTEGVKNGDISVAFNQNYKIENSDTQTFVVTVEVNNIDNSDTFADGAFAQFALQGVGATSAANGLPLSVFEVLDDDIGGALTGGVAAEDICIDFGGDGFGVNDLTNDVVGVWGGATTGGAGFLRLDQNAPNDLYPAGGILIRAGNTCTAGNQSNTAGDGLSDEFITRITAPTIAYGNIPTVLTYGSNKEVFEFSVTNDENDSLDFGAVLVEMTYSDVGLDPATLRLYEGNDTTPLALLDKDGAATVTPEIDVDRDGVFNDDAFNAKITPGGTVYDSYTGTFWVHFILANPEKVDGTKVFHVEADIKNKFVGTGSVLTGDDTDYVEASIVDVLDAKQGVAANTPYADNDTPNDDTTFAIGIAGTGTGDTMQNNLLWKAGAATVNSWAGGYLIDIPSTPLIQQR